MDARLLSATCGGVRTMSVYVPNGRGLDQDHYQYKLAWLARLRAHLAATCTPDQDVAICGDFNIAPTDTDVYDPVKFEGATHVSPPEREALGELEAWGLRDCLPHGAGTPTGCTRGGTTAPATSTRAGGCASTSCWRRRPVGLARVVGGHRPQRPQGHSSRRTTRPVVIDFD